MITDKESFLLAVAQAEYEEVRKFLSDERNQPMVHKRALKTNQTALHIASIANNLPMCELLLACGADVSSRDVTGKTPSQYTSDQEIQKILQQTSVSQNPLHQSAKFENEVRQPDPIPSTSSSRSASPLSSSSSPHLKTN